MDVLLQIEHILIIAGVILGPIALTIGKVYRLAAEQRTWRREVEIRLDHGDQRFDRHSAQDVDLGGRLDQISERLQDVRERTIRIEADLQQRP